MGTACPEICSLSLSSRPLELPGVTRSFVPSFQVRVSVAAVGLLEPVPLKAPDDTLCPWDLLVPQVGLERGHKTNVFDVVSTPTPSPASSMLLPLGTERKRPVCVVPTLAVKGGSLV